MSNDYYTHGSFPTAGSPGSSASMRSELDSITGGFDKLVTLTANANKLIKVNSGATAQTTSTITDDGSTVAINNPLTATTFNGLTISSSTGTLTVANSKTVTFSNTLTFTGTDSSSVAFGAGGTVAYTSNKLSAFASTTSAELASVISDETGSGSLVFAASPTLSSVTVNTQLTIAGAQSITGQITSTLATGTAPFVIASTTKVSNLNVDLLDGADWAAPLAIGSTTPAAGAFTTLTTTGLASITNQINLTASAGIQYFLAGNQDGLGTNNPTVLRFANGGLNIGHGDSWSGTGGTITDYVTIDSSGNFISTVNTSAASLTANKTFVFELTSDTELKIKVRGSDGVTRSVSLTLA